ncbi:TonB-dependent siderophore receptor [Salinisphaera hydrothermalis]|uniref:TonB-dependent siderophore receptor n=1 Tax=Salinisphaera hydrothermalis (strain C41B8) TaxID=1304275 RepID=A0A084IMH5_SALHC|nr:TonB-dependent siderophore receptor [Salinisphaera hydrothermalis]KEZ77909.1 TonB-dependent siderophore receptor [Salinisphaera hydrothermalis C41B8]
MKTIGGQATCVLVLTGALGGLPVAAASSDQIRNRDAETPVPAPTPAKQSQAAGATAVEGGSTQLGTVNVTGQYPGEDAPTHGYTAYTSTGATKTDTPLMETPQTVDVITRQQISDQGSKNVNDALRYTPGVFTGIAGASTRQDAIQLRGFSGGDVNNAFLDGMRLMSDPGAYSNFQIDPFMLERIDVVKGPSSVLYGRAQPGGLVNYVTKRPQAETERHLQFYGGSFDTYGGGFDFTGALPKKSWGNYRIVGHAETSDTQYDVVKSERYAIMPEVDLNLSDDTDLLLQAYIQHDPAAGFHGSVPYDLSVNGDAYGGTVSPSWVDTDAGHEKFDRQQRMFTYALTHHVNDHVRLRSTARYSDLETDLAQVYQYGFTGNGADLTRYYTGAREHLKAFSTDNNIQFEFATGAIQHEMLAGVDYQQRFNRVHDYGIPYDASSSVPTGVKPLDPFDPNYDDDPLVRSIVETGNANRKLKQFGGYLQDQMTYKRLHVLLSGREDYLRREYQDLSTADGATAKRSDDAFTGRVAVLYESQYGISPYFSYSEAFNPTAYSAANGQIAEPTKSNQYEIGVKYAPRGVNALLTISLYDLTQKNVQQRTAVTPITFASVGDIQSRGVEFTAKGDITDDLHVIAGYSYQDVEYQNDVASGSVTAHKGDTPARTPNQLASLWVTYDFPKRISAGLGGHYVGKSYADGRNRLKVPDYAVADAMVKADLGAWSSTLEGVSLRVNANNLFDKKYVASCFGAQSCYYGEERNVTATVDYRF